MRRSPAVSGFWPAVLLGVALMGCGGAAREDRALPTPGTSRFDVFLRTRAPKGEPPSCKLRGLAIPDAKLVRSFETQVTFALPASYSRVHGGLQLSHAHFLNGRTRDAWEWEPDVKLVPGEMWIGEPAAGGEDAFLFQVSRRGGYIPFAWEGDRELTGVRECKLRIGKEQARVVLFTLTSRTNPPVYGAAAYWRSPRDVSGVSTLALGPDEATQAEFVTIIRSAR